MCTYVRADLCVCVCACACAHFSLSLSLSHSLSVCVCVCGFVCTFEVSRLHGQDHNDLLGVFLRRERIQRAGQRLDLRVCVRVIVRVGGFNMRASVSICVRVRLCVCVGGGVPFMFVHACA